MSRLRVFVSSKMEELAEERLVVREALDELLIDGWAFEYDQNAQARPVEEAFLHAVEEAHLYLGLFWQRYGSATIREYERARTRGKDRLIYEKRVDVEGRDEDLQTFLDRIGSIGGEVTLRHFATTEELRVRVKEDVAVWIKERIEEQRPNIVYPLTPAEAKERRDLLVLSGRVKQFWIEGVLENSVHGALLHKLGMEPRPDAVEHPWEQVVKVPGRRAETIPDDKSVVKVFEETGRALLILGEPGAGKTITLLELARDLIELAEDDVTQPIPVVFNLSSWSEKHTSLLGWMTGELSAKYRVQKKNGQAYLERHHLLPLLDGLDEVGEAHRAACAEAINAFMREHGVPGIVVCCRKQEYEALGEVRLGLSGAITLLPLSEDQAAGYLLGGGASLAGLREAMTEDVLLRDLSSSPLMLDMMAAAYRGESSEVIHAEQDAQGSHRRLFDRYVERMLEWKGKRGQLYAKEQTLQWLSWLAHGMRTHGHSVFMIEQLQPSWFVSQSQRRGYILTSRLISGLLGGLFLGLLGGLFLGLIGRLVFGQSDGLVSALSLGLLGGLVFGLFLGLIGGLSDVWRFEPGIKWKMRSYMGTPFADGVISTGLRCGVIGWLIFGLIGGLVVGLSDGLIGRRVFGLSVELSDGLVGGLMSILSLGLVGGLVFGLFGGLTWGMRGAQRNLTNDVQMVETIVWSSSNALKVGVRFALVGAVFGWIGIILARKISDILKKKTSPDQDIELSPREAVYSGGLIGLIGVLVFGLVFALNDGLSTVLLWGLVFGLFFGLLGGIRPGIMEMKTMPNQGIKLSLLNAIYSGGLIGLVGVLVFGLLFGLLFELNAELSAWKSAVLIFGTFLGLSAGLIALLWFGGLDVTQHYTLRFMFRRKDHIPRNYDHFLDYAAKLIFLRKVGGGYIFIHRLLLEHFAAMHDEGRSAPSTQAAPPPPSTPARPTPVR